MKTTKGTRDFVAVDVAVDVVVFVGRLRESYGPDAVQKIQRRAASVDTRCKEMWFPRPWAETLETE